MRGRGLPVALAVAAALLGPTTSVLPWVTVGGHAWSARRVLRDGRLLGVLGGGAIVLVSLVVVAVTALAGLSLLWALRSRRRRALVAAGTSSSLVLLAGVGGLVLGDGAGPSTAMVFGMVGLSACLGGLLGERKGTGLEPSGASGPIPGPLVRRAAFVGCLVVALVGPVQLVVLLRGPSPNTPEAAMRSVLRAVDDRDPVALAAATTPEERTVLLEDGVPLLRQLRRVGLLRLGDDLRSASVAGASITEVQTTVTDLGPGIAAVRLTGGRIVPATAPAEVPILGWWQRVRSVVLGVSPSYPPGWDRPSARVPRDAPPTPLVFEREHGHWYLSLVRTVVSAAGLSDGGSVAGGSALAGASSPGGAVEDLLTAVGSLDPRAASRVLAPGEIGALVGDAAVMRRLQRVLEPIAAEYSLVLPGMETRTHRRGATAWVTVVRTGFDLRTTATDAPPFRVRYDLDTRCTTATLDTEVWTRCGRDAWHLFDDLAIPIDERDIHSLVGETGGSTTAQAFVVVRRGGRWYVSPGRTVLRALTIRLAGMDRRAATGALADLRDLLDAVRS